ncbi:MAG TPA: PHP domain-containing protein, partial [Streptosporangiaceae bacterium]|nr:PHP domain-containing protein [Streptosporangiaceae bacterium]
MGWDNPPVPWRELERQLSWKKSGSPGNGQDHRAAEDQSAPAASAGPPGPARQPPGPGRPVRARRPGTAPAWAELHCHSSYSFLDGASGPEDLVKEAAERGLTALAITDHDGMYGVPQFAQATARLRDSGVSLGTVFGAELNLSSQRVPGHRPSARQSGARQPAAQQSAERAGVPDPPGRHLLVLARDPDGYGR